VGADRSEGVDVVSKIEHAEPVEITDCQESDALPVVMLPGGSTKVRVSAGELGKLAADTKRVFRRGHALFITAVDNFTGVKELIPLKPAMAVSFFEEIAELKKCSAGKGGGPQMLKCTCPERTAKVILAADAFRDEIPRISLMSDCPVLVERSNGTLAVVTGYDEETGIFAQGEVDEVSLDQAVPMLMEIIQDFDFTEPGDRSRALASLVTPAIIQGGLLGAERAPMDGTEADS
jgi:hypothetical protein